MIQTIRQFFDACHPFGFPLLACSVALTAAILYHLVLTIKAREVQRLSNLLSQAPNALPEYCASHPSALTRTMQYALAEKKNPALPSLLESRLRILIDSQRAGMTIISIITNIAPMLGILGTAWGLVDIFGVFGSPSAGEGVALGISKALYTTIFGLAIAVPGVIALACFERSLERLSARINKLFTELLAKHSEL